MTRLSSRAGLLALGAAVFTAPVLRAQQIEPITYTVRDTKRRCYNTCSYCNDCDWCQHEGVRDLHPALG